MPSSLQEQPAEKENETAQKQQGNAMPQQLCSTACAMPSANVRNLTKKMQLTEEGPGDDPKDNPQFSPENDPIDGPDDGPKDGPEGDPIDGPAGNPEDGPEDNPEDGPEHDPGTCNAVHPKNYPENNSYGSVGFYDEIGTFADMKSKILLYMRLYHRHLILKIREDQIIQILMYLLEYVDDYDTQMICSFKMIIDEDMEVAIWVDDFEIASNDFEWVLERSGNKLKYWEPLDTLLEVWIAM